jgi:hypothetical protein
MMNKFANLKKKNSDDSTDLLKQQVCVVRSTLSAFNATLADIEHNGLVRKGLSDIQTYLDTLSAETAVSLIFLGLSWL